MSPMTGSRDWYEDGIAKHYAANGAAYHNPHEPIIVQAIDLASRRWPIDTSNVLDLSAGSGELSRAIRSCRPDARLYGCDPFTFEAYEREFGQPCERLGFDAIAAGAMRYRNYSLIGCSFAMHLCSPSLLPQLALELAQLSPHLLILTPHKRPLIREAWGWTLVGELVEQRVRARFYASTMHRLDAALRPE